MARFFSARMGIDNDTTQHLGSFLCENADRMTLDQFITTVKRNSELSEDLRYVEILDDVGNDAVLVMGGHAIQREAQRTGLCVLSALSKLLERQDVREALFAHLQVWDEVNHSPISDDGFRETVVVVGDTGLVVITEAGFGYIHVRTVWDAKHGPFYVSPSYNAEVIKITKDGILYDRESMPEIQK